MPPARIKLPERKVLRDSVYESLMQMLLSGSLTPGSALSIDALAADLGVSPTPVREAMVHLERTGLVTRTPMRSYRVALPLTAEQIGQLCDARLVLELGAFDFIAPDGISALIVQLTKAHEAHVKAAEKVRNIIPNRADMAAYRAYMDADWNFHKTIVNFTGNDYLISMMDNLPAHLHRLRQSVLQRTNDSDSAIREHQTILDAFELGDLAAARQAMRIHIGNVRARSLADATSVHPTGDREQPDA